MSKPLMPLALVALLTLAACAAEDATPAADADPAAELAAAPAPPFAGEAFGESLTLTSLTPIDAILADPESYVDERVMVEGTVDAVCDQMGCWMDLVTEDGSGKLQVKVEDGVIVFPVSAVGRRARVEGTIEKVERTFEQAMEEAAHRAEEQGVPFDSTTVTGPETVYRIRGLGAVVAPA